MSVTTLPKQIRGTAEAKSILIAVGGGKGGIGKSFVSSNLGIFLANMGFRTTVIDLDLGAPNLHTCLGEESPKLSFHDYIAGRIDTLADAAVATKFPRLRIITGANDHKELANISVVEQSRLMSAIYNFQSDFTILDLSAGTHTSTLDFFLMAHKHLVVLTPDPTSIENAYRFMRAAYFRRIKRFERQYQVEGVIADLMSQPEKHGIRTPADLLNVLMTVDPQRGFAMKEMLSKLNFELILNETRSPKDISIAHSIQTICRRYFGTTVNVMGHIEYDNAVWNALRKRRPLILEYPNSMIYSQLMGIARDLASPHLKKAVV